MLDSARSDLSDTESLTATTNSSLYVTNGLVVGAQTEVNLLPAVIWFALGVDSAEKLAAQGNLSSDNGAFTDSVSLTDVYCTNITVYNNAIAWYSI